MLETKAKEKVFVLAQPILIGVALAFAMIYPDGSVLSVALPVMQKNFDAPSAYLLWIVNIYILMRALLVFASGKISDIFSHRRMFIFGLVLFSSASIGCALAASIQMLIFFRGIQGIGSTIIFTSGMSLVTILVPASQRGRAISRVLTIGLMSMAVTPIVSGIIIDYLSWHWIFYIYAILGVVAVIFARKGESYQTETSSPREKFDWAGFCWSGIFTLFTTLGFNNSNIWGWASAKFICCIVIAGLAFIIFLRIESKSKSPLIDLTLFALPGFTAAIIIAAFTQIALLLIVFIGIFLQNALGYSPLMAGFLLLPMVALGLIFSNVGGYLVDTFGARTPIVSGSGLIVFGFIVTILLFNNLSYFTLLPLLVFSGMGMFMILGPVRTVILEKIPKEKHGMVNGILNGVRAISSVLGFALSSAIITNVEYFQAKAKLIHVLPTISAEKIKILLNLLSNVPQSTHMLSNFSLQMQETIKTIVLHSYINSFFWLLIFLGLLMFTNFLLGIFCIKKK